MLIGNGDSGGRPFLLSSPFLRAGQGSLSQTRHGFEGKGLVDQCIEKGVAAHNMNVRDFESEQSWSHKNKQ